MAAYQSSNLISNCDSIEDPIFLKYTEKAKEIREILTKITQDSLESLVFVDSIQRVGLCYLFEDEIEAILRQHYLATKSAISYVNPKYDLYRASLCFRLLRQQGYQVHADDFFGEFGEFKSTDGLITSSDKKSLLALYEASHLSMEGEEILHQAAHFCFHKLTTYLDVDDDEAKTVKNCLLFPQHKSVARFTAKNFLQSLKTNGENHEWQNLLRELVELEFAIMESLHKREILHVVKWWRGLGLSKEIKSSRNQPMKWHMWSMATLWDPRWSKHRTLLTKPISLVYAVDDIFDLYGTIDQLNLFTQAVNRWDISAAEQLPSCMKTCFRAIYDTTDEISLMVFQEHGWNPTESLRKQWGRLFDAFLLEAKWFTSGELPKAEEYLKNGVISSGVPLVLAHLFFLIMGSISNGLKKEIEILLNDTQGITYSVATLLRLLDDLGTAQDEQQEGYDGSYVECYMKERQVHSLEAAHEHVMAMVSQTWEDLNKHCLSSASPFSASFRKACLNAARMVPTMYSYDKNHRLPLLEHHIKSMLHDTAFTRSILG